VVLVDVFILHVADHAFAFDVEVLFEKHLPKSGHHPLENVDDRECFRLMLLDFLELSQFLGL